MSSDTNLCIRLDKRTDAEGRNFYVGKIRAPITIDCEKGACILVFVAEEGLEEVQIAPLTTNKQPYYNAK